jgi:hypothetical protein
VCVGGGPRAAAVLLAAGANGGCSQPPVLVLMLALGRCWCRLLPVPVLARGAASLEAFGPVTNCVFTIGALPLG